MSLEHNKLVRPILDFRLINLIYLSYETCDDPFLKSNVCLHLDFRSMADLRVLRLFGNPLEFLPDILPLHKLRHLSLANIRVVSDDNLRSVSVHIEVSNRVLSKLNIHFTSLVVKYKFSSGLTADGEQFLLCCIPK